MLHTYVGKLPCTHTYYVLLIYTPESEAFVAGRARIFLSIRNVGGGEVGGAPDDGARGGLAALPAQWPSG